MTMDISGIIKDWGYVPGEVSARIIEGADGRPKVQLRVDLGVLQMEIDGRPDGARPRGAKSLLDYHESCLQKHVDEHGSDDGFSLESAQCAKLREEGVQYYFRYLALFSLRAYDEVIRDTTRNLRLFDFVRKYGREEPDRLALEVYRPYVIMMLSRSKALDRFAHGLLDKALAALDEGIEAIRLFLVDIGQEKILEESREVTMLRSLKQELVQSSQGSPEKAGERLEELKKGLDEAIAREEFEMAARLRDEIRILEQASPK